MDEEGIKNNRHIISEKTDKEIPAGSMENWNENKEDKELQKEITELKDKVRNILMDGSFWEYIAYLGGSMLVLCIGIFLMFLIFLLIL